MACSALAGEAVVVVVWLGLGNFSIYAYNITNKTILMRIRHLLLTAVVAVATAFSASAAIDVGFIGSPLLAKYGYKAEVGSFSLGLLGQGAVQNLDYMTDNDYGNSAMTTNVAGVTLVMDEWVRVVPDADAIAADSNLSRTYYPAGTMVGFMMGAESSAVSVVDLDVIKLGVLYFYKDGQKLKKPDGTYYTAQLKDMGQAGLLDLALVHVDTKGTPQKVEAEAPCEFDGVGIGFGGVSAQVGQNLRFYYAYIDNWINVPIIRKYFSQATSATQGMVTGAKNLINNDLKDGATTAVLNIGGAYYDVMANRELPAGCEIGFVLTSGHLLDLNVGQVVKIKTLDVNGNEKEVSTKVNAVQLGLAEGGESKISIMTTESCYGARLERIVGIDLDLGATVVHYAYMRVPPRMRDAFGPDMPFMVNLDVIPQCNANVHSGGGTVDEFTNTHTNEIRLFSDPDIPIYAQGREPGGQTNTYWHNETLGNNWLGNPTIVMTLARKYGDAYPTSSNDVEGYLYIIHADHSGYTTELSNKIHFTKGNYYWQYQKKTSAGLGYEENGPLTVDADGSLDLSVINFPDREHDVDFDNTNEHGSRVQTYALYVSAKGDDCDNISDLLRLTSDGVMVPIIEPEYEPAGPVTDISAEMSGKTPAVTAGGDLMDYVVVKVPQSIGSRTKVNKIVLESDADAAASRPIANFELKGDGTWAETDGNGNVLANPTNLLGQQAKNGVDKLIVGIVAKGTKRHLRCFTVLQDSYKEQLRADFPELDSNGNNKAVTEAEGYNREYNSQNSTAGTWTAPTIVNTPGETVGIVHHRILGDYIRYPYTIAYNDATDQVNAAANIGRTGRTGDMATSYAPVFNQWVAMDQGSTFGSAEFPDIAGNLRYAELIDDAGNNQTLENYNEKFEFNGVPPTDSKADNYVDYRRSLELLNTKVEYTGETLDETTGLYNYSGLQAVAYAAVDESIDLTKDLSQADNEVTVLTYTRAYIPLRPKNMPEVAPTYYVLEIADNFRPSATLPTGIDAIGSDAGTETAPRYYDLQGREVTTPEAGMYIRVSGGKAQKVIFR